MPKRSPFGHKGSGCRHVDGRLLVHVTDDSGKPKHRTFEAGQMRAAQEWVDEQMRAFASGDSAARGDLAKLGALYVAEALNDPERKLSANSQAWFARLKRTCEVVSREVGDIKGPHFRERFTAWINALTTGWERERGKPASKYAHKTKRDITPEGKRKIKSMVATVIEWARAQVKFGIVRNPIDGIRLPAVVDRIRPTFSIPELRKLLAATEHGWWLPTCIMAYTGSRPSEAMGLRWEHVNFEAKRVTLYGSKGKTWRVMPLQPELAAVLMDVGPRIEGFVVGDDHVRERGQAVRRRKGKATTVDYAGGFFRFVESVGLDMSKRRTTYCMRHTFIAIQLAMGTLVQDLMPWVGHKDPELTINRYGRERDLAREYVKGWKPATMSLMHAPDSPFHSPEAKADEKRTSGMEEILRLRAQLREKDAIIRKLVKLDEPIVVEGLDAIPGPGSDVG